MIEATKYLSSPLGSFCNKIFCCCPNCRKRAVIKAEVLFAVPLCIKSARMQCLTCAFHQDWLKGKLYGKVAGTAQQRCPNCGHKWLNAKVYGKANGRLKTKRTVVCSHCKNLVAIDLKWQNLWLPEEAIDPYFGSPLWLQRECSGKTFWAYNELHLQVLKSYVEASLRDDRMRGKWSMTARLPQWITSAKNRQAVLRCINRLEQMLID